MQAFGQELVDGAHMLAQDNFVEVIVGDDVLARRPADIAVIGRMRKHLGHLGGELRLGHA